MGNILYYLIATGFLGLAFSFWKSYQVNSLEPGTSKTSEITSAIKKGTLTYLQAEYKFILLFAISLSILIFFKGKSETTSNGIISIAYIVGAGLSALAGYLQLQIALKTNEKISIQSQNSYTEGFSKAFYGSMSIGLIGVSFVVIGLASLLVGFSLLGKDWDAVTTLNLIAGFALGASSVALFARMGGGVFAKSADLSEAYFVKTEPGIKDKSLYSAASIANDAGQNINNIGGIGADLYESLSIALVASMVLGISFLDSDDIANRLAFAPVLIPLTLVAIGLLTSIGASYLIKANNKESSKKAIEYAEILGAVIIAGASYFVIKYLLPAQWVVERTTTDEIITTTYKSLGIFWSAFFGIVASSTIGRLTNIFVSQKSRSVKYIANKSFNGPAANILGGTEQALLSTGLPLIIVLAVCVASYYFAGFYGVGIAAVGMLTNTSLQNAVNAFAPISDNSNSIAIKAGLSDKSVELTNELKLVGIQSISRNKGFLTVAASMSVIALLTAFIQQTGFTIVDLTTPLVLAGLLVGVALPFILSSNMIAVVGRVSNKMIKEVQRQFIEIPALVTAKEILDKYNGDLTYASEGEKETVYSAHNTPDYKQCIEIGTYATIWETLIPSTIAIAITTLTGYFAGIEILSSLLLGTVAGSIILSLYQATIGSAWESTKYAFENGVELSGEIYSKESAAYQAALIGDKVGKPLKDTASPAMTILMKIMIVVAIILAPALSDRATKKKGLHLKNERHTTHSKIEKSTDKTLDLEIE